MKLKSRLYTLQNDRLELMVVSRIYDRNAKLACMNYGILVENLWSVEHGEKNKKNKRKVER